MDQRHLTWRETWMRIERDMTQRERESFGVCMSRFRQGDKAREICPGDFFQSQAAGKIVK